MVQVYHKRGDTLSLGCKWTDNNGTPINLVGYTIASQVKAVGFFANLTVVVTNAALGEFNLSATATATSTWPITSSQASRTFCDVQFTVSGVVASSETFQVVVLEDITQ